MSLFSSIQGLGSTMNVFQYGEQVIAENIGNASVPGYALQTLDISSVAPTNQDGLLIGSGVQATGVANTRNVYLDNQLKLELGGLGYNNARLSGLQQIAAIFPEAADPTATTGLQGAIANLSSAWSALATSPNSIPAKSAVLGDMQTLSAMFNTDAQQLFGLQENLNTQVNNEITTINGLLNQVVTLNKEISQGSTGQVDGQPNVLVDAREQVAEQLAQAMGANSTIDASGNMVVTFNGGTLADGTNAYDLEAIPSSTAVGFTGVGYQQVPIGTPTEVTSMITTGTLGGLLTSRDVDVKGARLALDKMAYGIISYSNQINDSFVASDGTTSHDLFSGTKAADMEVSAGISNPGGVNYIGGTRNSDPNTTAGDLATMQAALQNMDMYQTVATDTTNPLSSGAPINPAQSLISQVFTYQPSALATAGNPGVITIVSGGNAVNISWNVNQSLDTIISNINANSGGAFYATFDEAAQQVKIFSTSPLTVYDSNDNLGKALMLSSVLSSSASINNSPLATLGQMKPTQAMDSATNMADVFTQELTGSTAVGSGTVDGNVFNWTPNQTLLNTLGDITGASTTLNYGWNPPTQTATLVRSGDQSVNPGLLTAANPMTPIGVSDLQGNLTQVFNFSDSSSNASKIFSELVSSLSNNQTNTQSLATQSQNLVNNTNQLQAAQSGPDAITAYDAAQMVVYQRSFEAAARLQYVLDDMLNVLINQMGSPVSSNDTATS
jgi:flagellar hook-associated protein FlgK